MTPQELIELTGEADPAAVDLARWTSVATRVPPALLRLARLNHLPQAGPAAEQAFWFSPLVESRTREAALVVPEVGALLRRELRVQGRVDAARALLEALPPRPPLVRYEEELVRLLVQGAQDDAEVLLGSVISALRQPDRELLAVWASGLPRRIPEIRCLAAAEAMEWLALERLGETPSAAGGQTLSAEAIVLIEAARPKLTVGLRLARGALVIRDTPEFGDLVLPAPPTRKFTVRRFSAWRAVLREKGAALCVAFSPDGRRVATASSDHTARLWDAATSREIMRLEGHGGAVNGVAFSPDGRRVVTASGDSTARLWDAATGREIVRLDGHGDSVNGVAFSPEGRRVATASSDRTARLWDATTGREVAKLDGHEDAVNGVAFSPDGRRVATASSDRTGRLWDGSSVALVATFYGHEDTVNGVAFSPDGRRVATASSDRTGRIWDAATSREIMRLEGHGGAVNGVAFSPDGRRVVTASGDSTARLWDGSSDTLMATLDGHRDAVNGVAFSPDGVCLATAAADYSTLVWDLLEALEMGGALPREIAWLPGHGLNLSGFRPPIELSEPRRGRIRLIHREIVIGELKNWARPWFARVRKAKLTSSSDFASVSAWFAGEPRYIVSSRRAIDRAQGPGAARINRFLVRFPLLNPKASISAVFASEIPSRVFDDGIMFLQIEQLLSAPGSSSVDARPAENYVGQLPRGRLVAIPLTKSGEQDPAWIPARLTELIPTPQPHSRSVLEQGRHAAGLELLERLEPTALTALSGAPVIDIKTGQVLGLCLNERSDLFCLNLDYWTPTAIEAKHIEAGSTHSLQQL